MGTRADFYVGRDPKTMEWLGSVAFDGYPGPPGLGPGIIAASDEGAYRTAVAKRLEKRDGTLPDQGWPWPWEDSGTTDYAYAFEGGVVWTAVFGKHWYRAGDDERFREVEFPDMTDQANVKLFGSQSGLIVIADGEVMEGNT